MTSRSFVILAISTLAIVTLMTVATVAYASTFNRQLSIGMSGPDVSALQIFLAQDRTIYPQGLVTGYFGFLTKAAVSNFQSRHGLPPVGRVGPLTLLVLNPMVVNPGNLPALSQNTAPQNTTVIGTSTLLITPIPLLSGGSTKAGASVPVLYLQVTNTGSETVFLKGFTVTQNGSASDRSIIGLTTIDDRDNILGTADGSAPLKNKIGFVPANTTLAPGQTKVFTIRAKLASDTSTDQGKEITIVVIAVEATVPIKASFPIRGTTWTIN